MDGRSPKHYLDEYEKRFFSESESLDKFVMAPATTDLKARNDLTCGHPGFMSKIWYTYEIAETLQVTGMRPTENPDVNDSVVILPMILPLPKAWDIPIGPLCEVRIGTADLRK
jgi:hypothetical protein